jgi:hypothetical protein
MAKTRFRPQEDNYNKFFEFCKIACPDYVKDVNETHLKKLAANLRSYEIDLGDLLNDLEHFSSRYPNGVEDKVKHIKIPQVQKSCSKSNMEYKSAATNFINLYTNISLPASPEISCDFYDTIIRNLILKAHSRRYYENQKLKSNTLNEII